MKVLTVTPNPSVDHTVELAVLTAVRSTAPWPVPSRPAARASTSPAPWPGTATRPPPSCRRRVDGDRLEALLAPQRVRALTVPIAGTIRTNTTVVEADGTTTKLNEPGPELTAQDVDALQRSVVDGLQAGPDWFVSSGSLPPGAPVDLHARFVAAARRAGVRSAVDTSGAPRSPRPSTPLPTC